MSDLSTSKTSIGDAESNSPIDFEHAENQFDCINYPAGRLGAVTRKANELSKLLESETKDCTTVSQLLKQLKTKFTNFEQCCISEENRQNLNPADVTDFTRWKNEHLDSARKFITTVEEWLVQNAAESQINPNDSVSQVSASRSEISSVKMKLMEKRVKAELRKKQLDEEILLEERAVEQKFKLQLEQEKSKLKHKRELEALKLKHEKEEIDAMNRAMETSVSSLSSTNKSVKTDAAVPSTLPPVAAAIPSTLPPVVAAIPPFPPMVTPTTSTMVYQMPKLEPEIFEGDVINYRSFILSFEHAVARFNHSSSDGYYSLLRYTRGKPHELVKSCLCRDFHKSYEDARMALDKYYGNDIILAQNYLDRLDTWPIIKPEYKNSLEEFSIYLLSCLNMLPNNSHLNALNSWKEIKKMTEKLPYNMRRQFRSRVTDLTRRNEPLLFETFVYFVQSEVDALKIPLFGEIKDSKPVKIRQKLVNDKNVKYQVCSTDESYCSRKCICCGKENHHLDNCFFFVKKSLMERENFIKKHKLCFGCLLPNHMSKNCPAKLSCKKCSRKHPTSLHKETDSRIPHHFPNKPTKSYHYEEQRGNKEQALQASSMTSSRITCPYVPVGIRQRGQSTFIVTNMAMDNYATGCYMDEALLKRLNIKGKSEYLSLTTMNKNNSTIPVKIVEDLEILSLTSNDLCSIPKLYAKKEWPFKQSALLSEDDLKPYKELKEIPFRFVDENIGLLVGMNMPMILKPLEIVETSKNGPYASRHLFGWAFNGPISGHSDHRCFKTSASEDSLGEMIENYFSKDFDDEHSDSKLSLDDQKWEDIVSKGIKLVDGNSYEIPLPFKEEVSFPDNSKFALAQLNNLNKRLRNNAQLQEDYCTFMREMRQKNFVEEVPVDELNAASGKTWYLPHHGVRHKQKGKLRVVFNCSSKYSGVCLNDMLLQGPDLVNNLVGVLLRFREGKIALSADIEKMFYCVKIPTSDSNFLRFYWYKDDDIYSQPVAYRLRVHVFGAKSSPSCANYALQNCIANIDNEALKTKVKSSFYVDDFLLSIDTEENALNVLKSSTNCLAKCGFNLTEVCSNSKKLLKALPVEKLSKNLKNCIDLNDYLPSERALGLMWNSNDDQLCFDVKPTVDIVTKRSVLSAIFSVYDPLFILSPIIIPAKLFFQQICRLKLGWDEALPEDAKVFWHKWLNDMTKLINFHIPRCHTSIRFDKVELHIFCDGSETAYGACAYFRFSSFDGVVVCSLVMSKVRLTPLKKGSLRTIPRIELNSAKLAVQLYLKLKNEVTYEINSTYFWTDSTIVLGYIQSNSNKFQRFVFNRISFIRSITSPDQWHHVPGRLNVADLCSRGTGVDAFLDNKEWLSGPSFLYNEKSDWPNQPKIKEITSDDPELKQAVHVATAEVDGEPTDALLNGCSNFHKLKCRVATYLRLVKFAKLKTIQSGEFTVSELNAAELKIWKYYQGKHLKDVLDCLYKGKNVPAKHYLSKLTPYIDTEGVLRVKGRLSNADIEENAKHPIIVPKEPLATTLLIESIHKSLGHCGREAMISNIKLKYYIIGCTKLVKTALKYCLICRKVHGKPSAQFMADLPSDRVTGDRPPFHSTGIDFFGPFMVTKGRGRAQEKRYGVIFTCLASRACHLEVAYSLDTDSFVNSLRRFISRRGPVRYIVSDNGTNLVSGQREVKESIQCWNEASIGKFCRQLNIDWSFNPPHSSHYGGVYEREIRTIRKVFNSLICELENKISLNDEMLVTLFCEIENILNSRPLNAVSNDVNDLEVLTPNHILRLNYDICFPPGIFDKDDCYVKRKWRQIQFIADRFWYRWRKEYIPLLMERQKWYGKTRAHKIGDLVLIVDQLLPRNLWCLGKIVELTVNKGHVRSARIKVSKFKEEKNLKIETAVINRPINKLVLLLPVEYLVPNSELKFVWYLFYENCFVKF